jgi:hypothetical protein
VLEDSAVTLTPTNPRLINRLTLRLEYTFVPKSEGRHIHYRHDPRPAHELTAPIACVPTIQQIFAFGLLARNLESCEVIIPSLSHLPQEE